MTVYSWVRIPTQAGQLRELSCQIYLYAKYAQQYTIVCLWVCAFIYIYLYVCVFVLHSLVMLSISPGELNDDDKDSHQTYARFHRVHGENVMLSDGRTRSTRVHSFAGGVCFRYV